MRVGLARRLGPLAHLLVQGLPEPRQLGEEAARLAGFMHLGATLSDGLVLPALPLGRLLLAPLDGADGGAELHLRRPVQRLGRALVASGECRLPLRLQAAVVHAFLVPQAAPAPGSGAWPISPACA